MNEAERWRHQGLSLSSDKWRFVTMPNGPSEPPQSRNSLRQWPASGDPDAAAEQLREMIGHPVASSADPLTPLIMQLLTASCIVIGDWDAVAGPQPRRAPPKRAQPKRAQPKRAQPTGAQAPGGPAAENHADRVARLRHALAAVREGRAGCCVYYRIGAEPALWYAAGVVAPSERVLADVAGPCPDAPSVTRALEANWQLLNWRPATDGPHIPPI